uniref:Nudix hydrolase domain-containing protein n=1 Tax=Arundo donax TaxID=35708 RepID=A0A0A9F8S6_ARUDO
MEVLVVQEKYSASTLLGAWKLPTGLIHESEEIFLQELSKRSRRPE